MATAKPANRFERWLVAALFAAGFAMLFHSWLLSGFDRAVGATEDDFLAIATFEHWHHVFGGSAYWTDPIFFYPVRGTLGYTNAFFLLGLIYSLFRALGADPFTAYMVMLSTLATVGFFGFFRLATRHFGLPPIPAALGAFLFVFANMDAVKIIHAQSYCSMLLPVLCDLALIGWQNKHRRISCGAAAGLGYAVLFLTSFETAWFFGCYVVLLVLLYPAICGPAAAGSLARQIVTTERPFLLAAACAFALGMVPFLLLYAPVLLAGHHREFAEVASNLPTWRDLANVTPENAIWGKILDNAGIASRHGPFWEAELGFTPAVLVVFLTGLALIAARRLPQPSERDRYYLMLGLAVVIVWLLQMPIFGAEPWRAVWALVPGGIAIRYPFRSQLVANLFVALLIARTFASMRGKAVPVALGALLLVEQINPVWPPGVSRRAQLEWIDAVPPPPLGCSIFYLSPDEPDETTAPQRQDDAMLFAEIRNIPTVNGYSSWSPDGWTLDDPTDAGYPAAVRDWARRNGIEHGLCGLDPREGNWTKGLP